VRSEGADALGLIGDPSTGYDLFRRFAVEDDSGVRIWLAFALGATGYRPAVPLLTDALAEAELAVRYYAAQSLAWLGATSALPALRQALDREVDDWVKERMRWAIDELERS
jgi:HEAT repeat protein